MTAELHENEQSLWVITISPVVWALHFLLSYVTAAIWCARVVGRDGSLYTVQALIGIYTLVALAAIAWTGWRGYRRHRFGHAKLPHDADTPEDRYRFLGLATLLLSALSAVATIYVAIVAFFFSACH